MAILVAAALIGMAAGAYGLGYIGKTGTASQFRQPASANRQHLNASSLHRNTIFDYRHLAGRAQCRTSFIDGVSTKVSQTLKINLDTSAADAANSKFQRDVNANSDPDLLKNDFFEVRSAIDKLFHKAANGIVALNHTQRHSIEVQIAPQIQQLKSCLSENSMSLEKSFGMTGNMWK